MQHKDPDGFSSPIFTGVMTFVMGIATMMKVTRTMSQKVSDDSNAVNRVGTGVKNQEPSAANLPTPASISPAEMMTVMKRIAELEERITVMNTQPTMMPPEKEELLNSAVNRADALEQELMATKKVNIAGFDKALVFNSIPYQSDRHCHSRALLGSRRRSCSTAGALGIY